MRFAMAQINTTVGAINKNADKVKAFVKKARDAGADLVIFPELTLTGYPPKDLLENPSFIDANIKTLESLARDIRGIAAVVGFVEKNPKLEGKRLFNAIALLEDGRIKAVGGKTLLPSYDVFDEERYFDPYPEPQVIDFRGKKLGLSICEDIWHDEVPWHGRYYHTNPIEKLKNKGADVLINISASPYEIGKWDLRLEILRKNARMYGFPIFYVNQVGGNDEIIFDGGSIALDSEGEIFTLGPRFCEDLILVEIPSNKRVNPHVIEPASDVLEALTLGLRDYAEKCGFKRVLIGLSGGMDSSLTAVIASRAMGPENVLAVYMPSRYSSEGSLIDSKRLAENLGINYKIVSIEEIFNVYLKCLAPLFEGYQEDITEENLQARIRGTLLMALSNKFGALLLATGNKSEVSVGYCTLYGDTCGGLAVISDLPKTFIYEVAREVNRYKEIIPEAVFTKPPSAELKPDQCDQDTLPPYHELDELIKLYVEQRKSEDEIITLGYSSEMVHEITRKIDKSEYKRKQLPLGLKVSSRAFGSGRRMPIARGWEKS